MTTQTRFHARPLERIQPSTFSTRSTQDSPASALVQSQREAVKELSQEALAARFEREVRTFEASAGSMGGRGIPSGSACARALGPGHFLSKGSPLWFSRLHSRRVFAVWNRVVRDRGFCAMHFSLLPLDPSGAAALCAFSRFVEGNWCRPGQVREQR